MIKKIMPYRQQQEEIQKLKNRITKLRQKISRAKRTCKHEIKVLLAYEETSAKCKCLFCGKEISISEKIQIAQLNTMINETGMVIDARYYGLNNMDDADKMASIEEIYANVVDNNEKQTQKEVNEEFLQEYLEDDKFFMRMKN